MRRLLNRILYYSDITLHLRIIASMISVSLSRRVGYHQAIPASILPHCKSSDPLHITRIRSYCNRWFLFRTRLGCDDACFYRSALMCSVFRRYGVDARLNFGTMKEDNPIDTNWHFTGHCWVSYGTENIQTAYSFIIQYPPEGSL